MDYFWIRQDKRYCHTPVIQDFYSTFKRKDFVEESAARIPEKNAVITNSLIALDYVDILDDQMFAVSQTVRDIFRMYEPSMEFKDFCFLNNTLNTYYCYFTPVLDVIPCLKGYETHTPVLIKERVMDSSILRVQDAREEMVIIRLDVAESLLRRGVRKYKLYQVKWDK